MRQFHHFYRFLHTEDREFGMTEWFRCCENLKCPKIQLRHNSISSCYTIHVGIDENDEHIHNHETKDSEYGIHSCIKPYIDRYMGYNIKTMEMINHLSKEGKDSVEQSFIDSKTPSYAQITNYIKRMREKQKEIASHIVTLDDIEEFVNKYNRLPEDDDELFVPCFWKESKIVKGKIVINFRLFLTTKRLLSYCLYVSYINVILPPLPRSDIINSIKD